jgi:hypothetical protein
VIVLFMKFVCFSDDFKPASMDTNQVATVQVGKGNEVSVSVPHVEVSTSVNFFVTFLNHPAPLVRQLSPNWKLGPGDSPTLFLYDPKGSFSCMNHRQSTHHSPLINQLSTGEREAIK